MMQFFFLITIFILMGGCATYQNNVMPIRDDLTNGRCPEALKKLEELTAKNNGDQLVYLMDQATALQMCGDYKKSNQIFIKADKLSDQLDYHSVSRVTGATLLNEEMIQYKGDTFEKLFINAMAALNYLQLGDRDEALVEVRRINEKFVKYNADEKKKFELNSFSQYLSGLIWEADQKYDDACISYKSAYKLDPTYRAVGIDMLHGCWLARRSQEFDQLVKEVKPTDDELKKIKQPNKNEIIIVFLQGWGPRKYPRAQDRISAELIPAPSNTKLLQADISGKQYTSEPVYNVEKAAIDTLNADYGALVARRIGARVAKEVVADQVRQKDKALGDLAWLVMVASERADLRQWSTLPQTIQTLRFSVPNGSHKIKLTGLDRYQNPSESFPEIDFKTNSQKKRIFLVRSLK